MTLFSKRFLFEASLTIALTLVLLWMSPPPQQTIVIAVPEENGGLLRAAVKAFNEHKTGIEVQLREFGYDDLHRQVFDHGSDYDVLMVDEPWLTPLREKLRPLKIEDPEELPPSVLNSVRCAHSLDSSCGIGIPYIGNSELFVINRRLLKDSKWPTSWDEVVALASRGQERFPYGYAVRARFDDESTVTDEFMPVYWWALGRGGDADKLGAATRAAGILTSLAAKSPSSIALYGSYDVSALLLYGKIGLGITWADWAMHMADADPQAVRELVFGLPPGDAPELGIWALAIPSNSRHPVEAQRFIRFATQHDELKRAAMAGSPPLLNDLFEDQELVNKYPSFPAQLASLKNAKERPPKQEWHKCSEKKIADALDRLYYGGITLSEAAKKIEDGLNCP